MAGVLYGALLAWPWAAVVVVGLRGRKYLEEMRREREYFSRELDQAYDELDERLTQQAEDP